MRVTDAAQRVQRSAYPEAYEKWADESAVLAKALTGRATGAVECTVSGEPALRGAAAAAALIEGLRLDWGKGLGTGRRAGRRPHGHGQGRQERLAVRALAGRRTPGTPASNGYVSPTSSGTPRTASGSR